MSNYKWVQMSEDCIELRKGDFSSYPFFKVDLDSMNPLLLNKLYDKGIFVFMEIDRVLKTPRYVLIAIDRKFITITAPLYEYTLDSGKFVLISESYTDEVIDPAEYEWVKETYLHCKEEVANEQARVFEEHFTEKSLDGISFVITISSYPEPNYFYEQYIPEAYIKVCEKNCPFTRTRHEVVFIKKMDAKGKEISIKVPDLYKELVIGKGDENIKRVAKLINAKRINVI